MSNLKSRLNFFKVFSKPSAYLAFLFSLFLTLIFYFDDARIEDLKVGQTCDRFVVVQTDFNYIDKAATKLLKNQTKYHLGSIFKLDERALLLQLHMIQHELPQLSNELAPEVDRFIENLVKARFCDYKMLKKLCQLNIENQEHFYRYSHKAGGLPDEFWSRLAPQEPQTYIGQLISRLQKIPFILISDGALETHCEQLAFASVKPVTRAFKAGEVLLKPGDKIEPFHREVMICMQEAEQSLKIPISRPNLVASVILGGFLTFVYNLFLRKVHPDIVSSFSKQLLLTLLITLGLIGAKTLELLVIKSGLPFLEGLVHAPTLALSVLLIALLIDRQVALLSFVLMLLMSYLFLAFDPGRFILMNLMGSAGVLMTTVNVSRRRQIFISILQTYALLAPCLLAFHVYDKNLFSVVCVSDLLVNFGFMIVASLVVLVILPLIERVFKITTNMLLTEYLDPNHELLKRLTLEAPGTYQHSLLVGHLAEYAARAIGANALFCRVAALYHDIGKVYNPQYFTENQLGGFNIHRLLSPQESAQVIIAHVEEGEKLARKYNLPESFIDIMKEHHGTTLVYFFYKKELEKQAESKLEVNEESFRYKGRKPSTKESAILMIADCVEAASRSLENATQEEIAKMIEHIAKERLYDGQLDDSLLTFEDLKKIKQAMTKALVIAHHLRVRYPIHELGIEPL